jgi:hypothetical protein
MFNFAAHRRPQWYGPITGQTGVIEPGKWVRYVDGATTRLGIVRGTSVDIGAPDVWQLLTVETHVLA